MYILLSLFFISLIGLTFMVGRRLLMLQGGQILQKQDFTFETPHFEEWKYYAIKNTKKYGYITLVITIRLYFRSVNSFKSNYEKIKTKVRSLRNRNRQNDTEEKEVSKFLKIISDYKHKIREIKHKIQEEEENL